MKEHPIIFNTDMVKAILEGRKTQTRRILDPQPTGLPEGAYCDPYNKNYDHFTFWTKDNKMCLPLGNGKIKGKKTAHWRCKYGQVGDRLWVRETWHIDSFMDGQPLEFGYKDGSTMEEKEVDATTDYEEWFERITIQSTEDAEKAFKNKLIGQDSEGYYRWNKGKSPCRWHSSIFMPRWASRITLEITDVRVERLQEINKTDRHRQHIDGGAWAEGIRCVNPTAGFRLLWNSIHKKEHRWKDNPWVWVVSFKKTL